MNRGTLSVLFSVLVVATACALPGGLSGGGGSAPPELQYIFNANDNPVLVTPTLDSERQVEAVIPASGGTLSVTGADGTTFRLDIPDGALSTDALIRMIPVSQLDGMPFGSDPYAVQLEPEGLQLNDFATLTITPAQAIPIDQQIVFGYQEDGKDLILAAPVVDSSEIKIQVLHFSGNGVTKGLLADLEPVRERLGGEAERRLESALNEALIRTKEQGGDLEAVVDAFTGTWRQFEEQVLNPRLAAAGESCAAGRLALQTLVGHNRQKGLLLGDDAPNLGGILTENGLMDTVSEVCMKEEYELCRDDHIIHRILHAWLGLERQYRLLGVVAEGAPIPAAEQAKEYARRCLTFEMRFASQAVFDDGDGGGYDSSVESKVKIQFNPADGSMKGQAPLVNTAFEFKVDCSVTSNRGGGTFEAMNIKLIEDTKSPTDALGYVRDLVFPYYPGDTSESFTVTCEDQPPYTAPVSSLWTGVFLVLHQSEMSQAAGGFVLEGWEILGDEYYAKREWINEDAGLGLTEAGTAKLYHLPE